MHLLLLLLQELLDVLALQEKEHLQLWSAQGIGRYRVEQVLLVLSQHDRGSSDASRSSPRSHQLWRILLLL